MYQGGGEVHIYISLDKRMHLKFQGKFWESSSNYPSGSEVSTLSSSG